MSMTAQLNSLKKYLQEDSTNEPLLFDLIKLACQLKEFDLALTSINDFISNNGSSEQLIFNRATVYLLNHQPKSARADLQQITANHPEQIPSVEYNIAFSFYLERNFTQCLVCLNNILKFADSVSEIRILLARVLYQQSDLLEANAALVPFLASYQSNAEALGLVAMILLDCNELNQSKICAKNALAIDNTQYDALLAQATFDLFELKPEKAMIILAKILKTQPTNGRALSLNAQSLMVLHNIDDAKQQFYLSVKYMDNHIGTWHLLGWCEFVGKNSELAKSAFEKALLIDKNFAESHGALAVIAITERNFELANKLIRIAKRLDSQCLSAEYAESLLLEQNGESEKAQELVNSILARDSHLTNVPFIQLINNSKT